MEPVASPVAEPVIATPAPEVQSTPAPESTSAPSSGLDFIPETYRQDPTFAKYKSPDEFFKGVKNMAELVGKKQIVNGIIPPGEDAKDEDYDNFFKQIGRPDAPDKYALPEKIDGLDIDLSPTRKAFSEMAHKSGLNQRQAETLYKTYLDSVKPLPLEEAKKQAFPEDTETHFALANKGAKASGLLDKIEASGYGRDPIVLQLCAEIGKLSREGSFERGDSAPSAKDDLLQEARSIQMSEAYLSNDKEAHRKVEEIYRRVYGQSS